jgi:transcriptional regulator with XRE-family HTH domain
MRSSVAIAAVPWISSPPLLQRLQGEVGDGARPLRELGQAAGALAVRQPSVLSQGPIGIAGIAQELDDRLNHQRLAFRRVGVHGSGLLWLHYAAVVDAGRPGGQPPGVMVASELITGNPHQSMLVAPVWQGRCMRPPEQRRPISSGEESNHPFGKVAPVIRQPRPHLAQQRKAAGFTQETLAEVLHVDRSTVARWESGITEPLAGIRPKLARVLGVTPGRLAEILVERVDDTAASVAQLRSGRADPAAVQALAAQVATIAKRYESEPSASLVAEAGQVYAVLSFLLGQGGSERVQRELHQTATRSATLLGQLVWDASGRRDGSAALDYCDAAIEHATECQDDVAVAHAELRKAYVALYGLVERRDPRIGLTGAQAAAHRSQPVSHALHGLAQLHVAEAFAMLGEYRRCEQALSAAETALTRMQLDDLAAAVFSPAQFGRLAGSCYLFLGHPERAEEFLTGAVELLHDRSKTRSLVLGNLALSFIRQRQLEAAADRLHEAIDSLEQSRGGGGMMVVFSAARELYPWRHEAPVQDVHDRLLGLMAHA